MRLFYILALFVLASCSPQKKVLMCGNEECIDKKHSKEYFEKNLTIEIQIKENKNANSSLNLVDLNTKDENTFIRPKNCYLNEAFYKCRNKSLKKDSITNLDDKKLKKAELKEKKRIAKLKRKEEKKRLKKNKKLKTEEKRTNLKKDKKKGNIFKNIRKKFDKDKVVKNNEIFRKKEKCSILINCDIDQIGEVLKEAGKSKKYPDLSF